MRRATNPKGVRSRHGRTRHSRDSGQNKSNQYDWGHPRGKQRHLLRPNRSRPRYNVTVQLPWVPDGRPEPPRSRLIRPLTTSRNRALLFRHVLHTVINWSRAHFPRQVRRTSTIFRCTRPNFSGGARTLTGRGESSLTPCRTRGRFVAGGPEEARSLTRREFGSLSTPSAGPSGV